MPITSSAKKALRVSHRKHAFNLVRKAAMAKAIKNTRKLIAEKKPAEASKSLSETFKAIDKAAKTNLIKKNSADRKKSRLAAAIKRIAA